MEKLLLKKFCKIIRKTSSVAFLLKNLNCPIYPPITIGKLTPPNLPTYNYRKTDSAEIVFFACFENFKIGLRASAVESHLSKETETFRFCREI